MRQLVRNMASLIEIEIKKFSAVYQIIMHQEPPNELDAEITAKKLLDRGVAPFDGSLCSSPVLEQVFSKLLASLNESITANPQVQLVMMDNEGQILKNERDIFIYKLALINAWALAVLQEIHIHSRQVYDQLDDWIVEAVAQENAISQQIIHYIKECIQTERLTIDEQDAQLQPLELDQRIQTIQYRSDEIPLYLSNVQVPVDQVEATRFSTEDLRILYSQMRASTGPLGNAAALEQQTFTSQLVVAVRQGRIPLAWKYEPFEKLSAFCQKFQLIPLSGPSQGDNESPKMYQSKQGLAAAASLGQSWVDWKMALTFFALLNSPFPGETDLASLRVKLSDAGENQSVNREQFCQVEFWFDQHEGKPDAALLAKWAAEKAARAGDDESSEEEDDGTRPKQLDKARLLEIKQLLFDIYRVPTGEDKLVVPDFIDALIEHKVEDNGTTKYGEYILSN